MEHNIKDRLSLLVQQHKELRAISKKIDNTKETASPIKIRELLFTLLNLAKDHMKQEEEILVPLLEGMYHPNEQEIAGFILKEHQQLQSELASLLASVQTPEWDNDTVESLISHQLEHMFKEEYFLFPLIQHFYSGLRSKAQ
ncbi:hemerythrin domain-containing protein [Ammoniphilus sp. YIM 78166]|uniref:hemerythrin domain-containing protein n=1 Tax=Ammoniphilus sp. YIM 78166 TaxID=1644106 RepID=UPI00106FA74F|nr:hemerythrin domain-containing protein [Ammoniphilus sp. YIM 78166]